jgi:hypothetical protein
MSVIIYYFSVIIPTRLLKQCTNYACDKWQKQSDLNVYFHLMKCILVTQRRSFPSPCWCQATGKVKYPHLVSLYNVETLSLSALLFISCKILFFYFCYFYHKDDFYDSNFVGIYREKLCCIIGVSYR